MKVIKYDDIIFGTREKAEEVLDRLKEIAKAYGQATLTDFKDLAGLTSVYTDNQYRWTLPMLNHTTICRIRNGWIIKLIDPIIENKNGHAVSTTRFYEAYKSPNVISPTHTPTKTSKPEPKPVYIIINTEEIDDIDDVLCSVFHHIATAFSREVHITIT